MRVRTTSRGFFRQEVLEVHQPRLVGEARVELRLKITRPDRTPSALVGVQGPVEQVPSVAHRCRTPGAAPAAVIMHVTTP